MCLWAIAFPALFICPEATPQKRSVDAEATQPATDSQILESLGGNGLKKQKTRDHAMGATPDPSVTSPATPTSAVSSVSKSANDDAPLKKLAVLFESLPKQFQIASKGLIPWVPFATMGYSLLLIKLNSNMPNLCYLYTTWLSLIPKVSARIVAMLQKGELDQAMGLKLLGQAAVEPTSNTPKDRNPGNTSDHAAGASDHDGTDGDDAPNADDMKEVDDLLKEAKKLKNDTLLNTTNSFNVYSPILDFVLI